MAFTEYLDAEELMHLAMTASRRGRTDEAIGTLKRALASFPDDPRLHYVLGNEYVQIGLMDRAVGHIQHAITLNPKLEGARFQLGFLYLNAGHMDTATDTWAPLDTLGEEHPLYLFKTGLLHLAKNEPNECEDYLRRGMAANTVDAALNHDMARILKQVQANRQATAAPATDAAAAKPETPTKPETPAAPAPKAASKAETGAATPKTPKNVVLSAYRQNETKEKEK